MRTGHTIVSTIAALDAEEQGGAVLAALLQVAAPSSWPPENNDADTRAFFRAMISRHPDEPGFGARYIVADGKLAGTCGFIGPPDASGTVEIGYSVIPADQRKGIATAAVQELVAFALADRRVVAVRAETSPDAVASQKVLLNAGFVACGMRTDADDGDVACFRLGRPDHPTR